MQQFTSVFPYDQSVINVFPVMSEATVDQLLQKGEKAYASWSAKTFSQRADVLNKVAALLRENVNHLASVITHEMGKVMAESKAEIEKCAVTCEYFAAHAERFLADEYSEAGYSKSFITYQPIGAVLAIMPWNFPFWQVFRYAAPTLMAGNITFLKHAPNVTGCAIAIEKLFLQAGAEEGVFQSLIVDTPVVEKIIAAGIVQGITLTGSERAGSAVAALAGKHIKKQVLELGGSDALIVLADANLQEAAKVAVQSRMQNAGQSCIAAKRFIVVKEVLDDFITVTDALIKQLIQGNPLLPQTTTGPMARTDLAEQLHRQVQQSVERGAVCVTGGHMQGCNYQPSLLLQVKKGMPAFDEETFGPVATIISAQNENDAIALANSSKYRLGASLWTTDT